MKCACGCGEEIPDYYCQTGRTRKYLYGHAAKAKYEERDAGPTFCACGCGERLDPSRRYPSRYILGHIFRDGAPQSYRRLIPPANLVPSGVCECGCGSPTPISIRTQQAKRLWEGYPIPYCLGHAPRKTKRNGRVKLSGNYIGIYNPETQNYDFEHRVLIAKHLGRPLESWEESSSQEWNPR